MEIIVRVVIKLVLRFLFSLPYVFKNHIYKKRKVSLKAEIDKDYSKVEFVEELYSPNGLCYLGMSACGLVVFYCFEADELEKIERPTNEVFDIKVYVNDFFVGSSITGVTLGEINDLWLQGPREHNGERTIYMKIGFNIEKTKIARKMYVVEISHNNNTKININSVFGTIVNMVSLVSKS